MKAAARTDPDYLLLTTRYGPSFKGRIRDLIARNVPLASVIVKLRCDFPARTAADLPSIRFSFLQALPAHVDRRPACENRWSCGWMHPDPP